MIIGLFIVQVLAKSTTYVAELTRFNFDKLVFRDGSTTRWFVKFYAPSCLHCRKLEPVWEDLAGERLEDESVRYGRVNCQTEKDLCQKFSVQYYPTLLLFDSETGQRKEFSGSRGKSALQDFAKLTSFAEALPDQQEAVASDPNSAQPVVPDIKENIILPDEAEFGPATPKSARFHWPNLHDFNPLDYGPGSRLTNLYFFGAIILAALYIAAYISSKLKIE